MNPKISALAHFKRTFNYKATSLDPVGISVIVHIKLGKRLSYQFSGKDGWSEGVSLEHYCYQRVVPKCSCSLIILNMTKVWHQHITQPSVTAEEWVLHSIQHITVVLQGMPHVHVDSQLLALRSLQDTINR